MKVKVIKEFVDKYTGKLHPVGEVFSCDDERLKEIQTAGKYVEEAEETTEEKQLKK